MRREDTSISAHIDLLLSDGADAEEVRRGHRIIGRMLRWLMAERGLTTSPARFLGEPGDAPLTGSSLADFVADAYGFAVVDRLRSLGNQRKLGRTLGGFVTRNLRNFLTSRQEKADPVGARIFERLEEAVKRLVKRRALVLEGAGSAAGIPTSSAGARLHNDMVFGNCPVAGAKLSREDLDGAVRLWLDELLPGLVSAYRGEELEEAVELLAGEVVAVSAGSRFRLGDLAKVLKDQTRARWSKYWEQGIRTFEYRDEAGDKVVEVESLEDFLRELTQRDLILTVRQKIASELAKQNDDTAKLAQSVWSTVTQQSSDPRVRAVDSASALAKRFRASRHALGVAMQRISEALRGLDEYRLLRPGRRSGGYSD